MLNIKQYIKKILPFSRSISHNFNRGDLVKVNHQVPWALRVQHYDLSRHIDTHSSEEIYSIHEVMHSQYVNWETWIILHNNRKERLRCRFKPEWLKLVRPSLQKDCEGMGC